MRKIETIETMAYCFYRTVCKQTGQHLPRDLCMDAARDAYCNTSENCLECDKTTCVANFVYREKGE